jgi:hypothetical protein
MTLTQASPEEFCVAPFGLEMETEIEETTPLAKTRLLSGSLEGLNIAFTLAVVKQDGPFALSIPWTVHVACPRCFGQGRIFTHIDLDVERKPTVCPRCGGQGYMESSRPLYLEVTESMAEAGAFIIEGAGAYDPKTMGRGDLRIVLTYVDESDLAMAS